MLLLFSILTPWWDVTKVIKYLVALDCDKDVIFKDLILILTMLLQLTAVARTAEIYLLVVTEAAVQRCS